MLLLVLGFSADTWQNGFICFKFQMALLVPRGCFGKVGQKERERWSWPRGSCAGRANSKCRLHLGPHKLHCFRLLEIRWTCWTSPVPITWPSPLAHRKEKQLVRFCCVCVAKSSELENGQKFENAETAKWETVEVDSRQTSKCEFGTSELQTFELISMVRFFSNVPYQ